MKTVAVLTKNLALKEKLLVDLSVLKYRVQTSDVENSDILITDLDTFRALSRDSLNKAVLVVLNEAHTSMNGTVSDLMGADDILLESYNSSELDLRLKMALIKRGNYEQKSPENVIKIDGMVINFDSYEVIADGKSLDLTFKEYELLKCLVTRRGRVYTRDQLLNIVWGYDYYGGTRTVDVHIRRLRAKLGRYESFIETVRNVGYRFKR